MKLVVLYYLPAVLVGFIILQLIHPTLSKSESDPDYMYDLDEDNIMGETGIDFGSPYEPMTFTSFKSHHNHDYKLASNNNSKTFAQSSAEVEAFKIGKTESGQQQLNTDIPNGQLDITEQPLADKLNKDSYEKFESKLSTTGDYIFGSLLVVFCFLSIVGNSCILLVFCFRHRRLSPAEVFLVNLGIVDILLSLASYPMSMMASFKHRWDFGEMGCTLYAFVCYFLGVTSIFSIVGIALIRYIKTCTPAQGNQITCWTSCKMVVGSYVVALIWATMPLVGFGNYEVEPFGLSCTLDWVAKNKASQIYIILVTIFCVFLPLLIILFCYSNIIILVKQSDALMRNNGVNKRNGTGSDLQLTWISGIVTAGFIISWSPYSVVSLWTSFRGKVVLPMWATPIPVLMAKSSIAYNPLIYIFFTARYREDLISLIQNWICSSGNNRHSKSYTNNNNNIGGPARSTGKRSIREARNTIKGNGTGNISPESGSSSQTTRQLTSTPTTTHHLLSSSNNTQTVHSNDEKAVPAGYLPVPILGSTNCINIIDNDLHNNNGYDEDSDYLHEVEDYGVDDEDEHNTRHETRILILQDEVAHYYPNSHHNVVPSQVITMITGNGTSTIVSTRSATRKLMSAFTA